MKNNGDQKKKKERCCSPAPSMRWVRVRVRSTSGSEDRDRRSDIPGTAHASLSFSHFALWKKGKLKVCVDNQDFYINKGSQRSIMLVKALSFVSQLCTSPQI